MKATLVSIARPELGASRLPDRRFAARLSRFFNFHQTEIPAAQRNKKLANEKELNSGINTTFYSQGAENEPSTKNKKSTIKLGLVSRTNTALLPPGAQIRLLEKIIFLQTN